MKQLVLTPLKGQCFRESPVFVPKAARVFMCEYGLNDCPKFFLDQTFWFCCIFVVMDLTCGRFALWTKGYTMWVLQIILCFLLLFFIPQIESLFIKGRGYISKASWFF